MYLQTTDNQFRFKSKHAIDMCIFTIKNFIDYDRRQNSHVNTSLLDASKAFDHVNHWTLFSKLINCKVPLLLVQVIVYWYRTQLFYIRWGPHMSESFKIFNGVRQGGILSPKLFAVYVGKLSVTLNKSGIGCNVGTCVNHFFYADDLCLLAPTAMTLQKIINICYDYGAEHGIVFNAKKSYCVVFKPKRYKPNRPTVSLAGTVIPNLNPSNILELF